MKKTVSVIINTKNEEKNIENCLKSVLDQSYGCDNMEIIVVDNNSTDHTKEIAQGFLRKNTALNLKIFNRGPERSAQKNFGVEKSSGEYFIHLDADMTLGGEVMEQCVEKVENNNEIVALYIPEIVTGEKFFSKVRRFERSFYNNTAIDGVRFIKKDVFLTVGGFDEKMYACEDWDITKKLKKVGKTDIIEAALFHNETEFDLGKYLKKKKYYSGNMNVYIEKWGRNDSDIQKQFGIRYRFLGVFTENGKWKKMLAHPILTLGMYFLRILVGFNFIFSGSGKKQS